MLVITVNTLAMGACFIRLKDLPLSSQLLNIYNFIYLQFWQRVGNNFLVWFGMKNEQEVAGVLKSLEKTQVKSLQICLVSARGRWKKHFPLPPLSVIRPRHLLWRVSFLYSVCYTERWQGGERVQSEWRVYSWGLGLSCSPLRPWHGTVPASWGTGWWKRGLPRQSVAAGGWEDSSRCSWWTVCCRGPARTGGCAGWGCRWGIVPPDSPVYLRTEVSVS